MERNYLDSIHTTVETSGQPMRLAAFLQKNHSFNLIREQKASELGTAEECTDKLKVGFGPWATEIRHLGKVTLKITIEDVLYPNVEFYVAPECYTPEALYPANVDLILGADFGHIEGKTPPSYDVSQGRQAPLKDPPP